MRFLADSYLRGVSCIPSPVPTQEALHDGELAGGSRIDIDELLIDLYFGGTDGNEGNMESDFDRNPANGDGGGSGGRLIRSSDPL